ncbi:MAG: T9SS type A sorting domain-containing protein [Bacteroidia bacterium]
MKKFYHFLLSVIFLSASAVQLSSQITCNPGGNLWVYTNYDGGVLNINVDVNIPNIKIGICTYEPTTINITGAYAGNVTEVRYAGFVSTTNHHCSNSPTTTTINSPSGTTSVNFLPPSTLTNPNGSNSIVCAYSCSTTSNQGGCNTADQIKAYFQSTTGGTLVSYFTQYGCWSSIPYNLGAGGNCCNAVSSCFIAASAGSDLQICAGDQTTLNGSATGGASVYSWTPTAGLSTPNSAVTVASPTITTTYVLTAGDGASCSDMDTIVVTVNPLPIVVLGADTTLCGGTILLNAGNAGMNFLWSDNSSAQTLNVTVSGTYDVSVTNTVTGCTNADNIVVTINTPPTVNIGIDTTLCGNSLLLDAGNPGMTYLWSNSTSQQTLTAFASGTYSVTVTDANGCTAAATINITFNSIPAVTFTAAVPIICLGDQLFPLTTGSPTGGTYSGTGVTAGNFDPQSAGIGTYAITYTFTDSVGCTSSATDSVMVDACMGTNGISGMITSVFPNPSGGNFQVNVSHACKAELTNGLGQIVETKMLVQGSNTMGNDQLAEGTYTLRLTGDKQKQVMRVVIQR